VSFDILLIFGIILVVGLSSGEGIKKIKSPQVVGFLLAGVLLGPTGFNIITAEKVDAFIPFTNFALAILGFNIGAELEWKKIKALGKSIVLIVIFEALLAFIFITVGVWLISNNLALALILGSLGSASAPAGIIDVIYEYKSKGPLTTTLIAVVGLDDVMALFIYSFAISFSKAFLSPTVGLSANTILLHPLKEIGGSILLGVILGFVFIFIAKRIQNKLKLLILTIGVIFLAAGAATQLGLSLLLTAMAVGIVTVNVSFQTSHKIMNALNEFVPPIYIVFFSFVGARLNLRTMGDVGIITFIVSGAYIILRSVGKYIGTIVGSVLSKAQESVRKYLGFSLLSQAGVAIGLAIFSANEISGLSVSGKALGATILLVITLTTFVAQIAGPPLVKYAIFKADEQFKG
jgi:Kef-type K+ transport system membrane component KefB